MIICRSSRINISSSWHEKRINPEAWQTYCYRADRLKKLGRYEEALADYEKCFVIQKPPRLADVPSSMAQFHELMGDYAAAIDDRERIFKCLQDEHSTIPKKKSIATRGRLRG